MRYFNKITLQNWRQFEAIEIDLQSNITIITGKNGCGKTTILNILGRHFGWNVNLISTPYIGKRSRKKVWNDVHGVIENDLEKTDDAQRVGGKRIDNNYL